MLYIAILTSICNVSFKAGKKFGKVTLDYVSSLNDDVEIAHHDILGSQAHTIMLYENKVITKKEVKKILKGLEDLKKEKFEKNQTLRTFMN